MTGIQPLEVVPGSRTVISANLFIKFFKMYQNMTMSHHLYCYHPSASYPNARLLTGLLTSRVVLLHSHRVIPWNHKLDHVIVLLDTLQWCLTSFRVKAKHFSMAMRPEEIRLWEILWLHLLLPTLPIWILPFLEEDRYFFHFNTFAFDIPSDFNDLIFSFLSSSTLSSLHSHITISITPSVVILFKLSWFIFHLQHSLPLLYFFHCIY